jgi:glycosyltransferase involved in cell wall biosynthesis
MANPMEMSLFVAKAFLACPNIVKQHQISHCIVFFTIPNGPLGWWLRKRYRIPYILSLRGGDVPGLVPEIEDVHRLLKPIRRTCLSQAKAIVANAKGLAQLSEQADPYPVQVIPNGVDPETFSPGQHRFTQAIEMIFVGRFHRQKNLPELLKQFARFCSEYPENPVVLHMVGQGEYEEDLKFQSEALGIQQHLQWHGWCSKSELVAIHQRCHLMLNPSFYEGLPNAVLEGMACGLPILVSDIPGNADLVTPACGWSFDVEDSAAFYTALCSALSTPIAQLLNMGEASRERVTQHYSWHVVAEQYLKAFELSPSV